MPKLIAYVKAFLQTTPITKTLFLDLIVMLHKQIFFQYFFFPVLAEVTACIPCLMIIFFNLKVFFFHFLSLEHFDRLSLL